MTISQFRTLIEEEGKLNAVNRFQKCDTENESNTFIYTKVQELLSKGQYGSSALLLSRILMFDPNPQSVRRIWRGIEATNKRLIMGCGSAGKSFSVIVWLLLDWLRDPEYTRVKLVSTSEGHAKANTFSSLV